MLGELCALEIQPSEGEIRFDGIRRKTDSISVIRSQVAYVPDYPIVFDGTILQNLTMFRGGDFLDQALPSLSDPVELQIEKRLFLDDAIASDTAVRRTPSEFLG